MADNLGAHALELFRSRRYLEAYDSYVALGRKIGMDAVAANLSMCLRRNAHVSADGSLASLRVATIMDEFTWLSFMPECTPIQLEPNNCVATLEVFQPHLLFVESAWEGKDKLWNTKINDSDPDLQDAIHWCNEHHIPTVFWNKEDPVHFKRFLQTSAMFDFVFTTDLDCVGDYKLELKHERVFFLPFACQPARFNPIAKVVRKEGCSFAGSWYRKYAQRCIDFCELALAIMAKYPLDIYDRNFGRRHEDYKYPPSLRPLIKGNLPGARIDEAYKGYSFGLSMNTVKQSPTMFARRAFELMASDTNVICNYSTGLRNLLGDLAFCTDNGGQLKALLDSCSDLDLAKRRLLALRKVMCEHSYAQRLGRIAEKVFGLVVGQAALSIHVVAFCVDMDDVRKAIRSFSLQTHPQKRLTLFVSQRMLGANPGELSGACAVHSLEQEGSAKITDFLRAGEWLAVFDPADWHGSNYLLDLGLATRYWPGSIIGKGEFFTARGSVIELGNRGCAYHICDWLPLTATISREGVINYTIAELRAAIGAGQTCEGLAVDPFNYCKNGARADQDQLQETAGDLNLPDQGIALARLYADTDYIAPVTRHMDSVLNFKGYDLLKLCCKSSEDVKFSLKNDALMISSKLASGTYQYFWSKQLPLQELGLTANYYSSLVASGSLDIQYAVLYCNGSNEKITHQIFHACGVNQLLIPVETKCARLGLRISGKGVGTIDKLTWGLPKQNVFIPRKSYLVLATNYPSYADLYKNAFIHSRVQAYKKEGMLCDVFCLHPGETFTSREFEGIDVMAGGQADLNHLLQTGKYKIVMAHLLNEGMWNVLKTFPDLPKIIWMHGVDIQPWQRRAFNFARQAALDRAVAQSDKRMAMWREVMGKPRVGLHFVFVSHHFADTALADVGIPLDKSRYSIIHNYINTDIFRYFPKTAGMRKNILSIRPYVSKTYANDLTIKAILALSKEQFFADLRFCLVGSGELFAETTAPLRKFANVRLVEKFIPQAEITALHKEHGIFLCPSRSDTQGVSRDEAMASGLVPITNAVEAIPEFTDSDCAILAPGEDYLALAEGITRLYHDPDLFLRMSAAAAARPRIQSDFEQTIKRELDLIRRMEERHNGRGF